MNYRLGCSVLILERDSDCIHGCLPSRDSLPADVSESSPAGSATPCAATHKNWNKTHRSHFPSSWTPVLDDPFRVATPFLHSVNAHGARFWCQRRQVSKVLRQVSTESPLMANVSSQIQWLKLHSPTSGSGPHVALSR